MTCELATYICIKRSLPSHSQRGMDSNNCTSFSDHHGHPLSPNSHRSFPFPVFTRIYRINTNFKKNSNIPILSQSLSSNLLKSLDRFTRVHASMALVSIDRENTSSDEILIVIHRPRVGIARPTRWKGHLEISR